MKLLLVWSIILGSAHWMTNAVFGFGSSRKPGVIVPDKTEETYDVPVDTAVSADAAVAVEKKTKEQAVEAADEVKKAEKKTKVVIQSPLGGEITLDEILERVGIVDEVYIRVDENKVYWVKGEESGSMDLW